MTLKTSTLICGAGIAGLSTAYHLAVRHGISDIVVADPRPPLSLTSDKSTECYRNWWPDGAMVALTNHSIDIMEQLASESSNRFQLNRRGYLYLSADPAKISLMENQARKTAAIGGGELRIYRDVPGDPAYQPSPLEGYAPAPTGADLFLAPDLIQAHFPGLSAHILVGLHVRRAGWFSAQQLGMYFLEGARAKGMRLIPAQVIGVDQAGGRVTGARLSDGSQVGCDNFVNAAGPAIGEVAGLSGIHLPVFSELHLKVAFRDPLNIIPRNSPLLIWNDRQHLPWDDDERALLAEDPDLSWLLGEMPPGAHTRPEGGADSDSILLLWEYQTHHMQPVFPPPLDEHYPEIALRGMAAMLPAMSHYFQRSTRPRLDGGYYTRTAENRPLIGPLPVGGMYLIGALSGFGLMTACAAGELLAAHLTGCDLPPYAASFLLNRYEDPTYQKLLAEWDDSGQL